MVERIVGVSIAMLVLADVFVTVLYARMYGGFVAMRLARVTAALFRRVTPMFGRCQGMAMSVMGPVIVVQTVAIWFGALTLAMALVVHPALGHEVHAQNGETPTDFVTALYVGGSSISIVAASSFVPQTTAYRIAFLVASTVGFAVLSLVVTYLLQIYNSLHRRNTLGLKIEMLSGGKGDAAELIARLGPRGRFETSTSTTSELAAEMSAVKEAHHFYPVLVYFRFAEPFYAVSRFTLVSLDAYALLASAVDDEMHGWMAESGNMLHLWESAKHMLEALTRTFSPGGAPKEGDASPEPTPEDLARWRARWEKALPRLRAAGIATTNEPEAGFARYVALRRRFDRLACDLGETLGFSLPEIDVAGSKAKAEVIQRQPWGSRGGSSSPSFFY